MPENICASSYLCNLFGSGLSRLGKGRRLNLVSCRCASSIVENLEDSKIYRITSIYEEKYMKLPRLMPPQSDLGFSSRATERGGEFVALDRQAGIRPSKSLSATAYVEGSPQGCNNNAVTVTQNVRKCTHQACDYVANEAVGRLQQRQPNDQCRALVRSRGCKYNC